MELISHLQMLPRFRKNSWSFNSIPPPTHTIITQRSNQRKSLSSICVKVHFAGGFCKTEAVCRLSGTDCSCKCRRRWFFSIGKCEILASDLVGRRVVLAQWVLYQMRQIHNTRNSERSLGLCLKLVTMQPAKPRPFCPCGWPPLLGYHLRLFTAAERANPSVPAKSIQEMNC